MYLKKTKLFSSAIASASIIFASSFAMAKATQNINNLPEEGKVEVIGTVNSIDSKKEFTLKDKEGKTIKILSPEISKFNKGDNVEVHGHIGNNVMGTEKEITAFTVKINETDEADDGA
jgi:hypothetical protein